MYYYTIATYVCCLSFIVTWLYTTIGLFSGNLKVSLIWYITPLVTSTTLILFQRVVTNNIVTHKLSLRIFLFSQTMNVLYIYPMQCKSWKQISDVLKRTKSSVMKWYPIARPHYTSNSTVIFDCEHLFYTTNKSNNWI